MRQPLHEPYLPPDRLLPLDILNLLLLINLQRNFLIQLPVHANMNNGVGTLANLISNNVITHTMFIRKYDFICCLLLLLLLLTILFLSLLIGSLLSLRRITCVGICCLLLVAIFERWRTSRRDSFLGRPDVLSGVLA